MALVLQEGCQLFMGDRRPCMLPQILDIWLSLAVVGNFLSQADTPVWHCSQGNRKRTALRAFSSSGLENVSSLRLVFLASSDDLGHGLCETTDDLFNT